MDKIKKIKILSAVSIIGTILAITVAFALITRSMVINGSGNVKPALWDIHFKDISSPTITGGASVITAPTVADKGAKIDNLEVRLSLPQDKIEYTVYIENSGDMNAKIDEIKYPDLKPDEEKIFKFSAKYEKDGSPMQVGDTLYKGQTKKVIITIEYLDISDKNLLPKETKTIDIDFKVKYVQDNAVYTTDKTEKIYTVGDKFCLDGESECFYVISDNGDTVTALSRYNVNINTLRQINGNYLAYSNSNYWNDSRTNKPKIEYGSSYPVAAFDSNSNLYFPLKQYEDYLKNNLNKNIVEITLLKLNQAKQLGCPSSGMGSCKTTNNPAPSWLYSTRYWLNNMSYTSDVTAFSDDGSLYNVNYSSSRYGLRPVITISKEEID